MELINRYLQAVGFWLPRKQRQDILAELAEDLQSQIEEKEAGLNRKLSETELEALLKERGRPVLVANRYLPQQYLIGPLLFPIYRFVLIVVGLCYLVPWIIVALGLMWFSSTYRSEHIHDGWFNGVVSLWSSWWMTAIIAMGVVTIIFAMIERANAKSRFLEDWEPRKLPAVRDRNQIPRSSSIIEFATILAFCVWWVTQMSSPIVVNRPDVRTVLSSLWPYFFWGFGLVALVRIQVSAVNIVRPFWTPLRASLRLVTNAADSALFGWLFKVHILAGITVVKVPAEHTLKITNAINFWAEKTFPIVVIVGVAVFISDVYRIVRVRQSQPPLPSARQARLRTS